MYTTKTLVAAAALAVLSAAGIGSATAQPWNHHPVMMHQHYVERGRIDSALRFHNYRLIGDPYFLRGHYVVRTHDRFGRLVVVEVDPFTGAFIGEFRV